MSSIPVIAGGAAVDCKPSVIVGGAEIPIYDAYVVQGGQAVKVYQSAIEWTNETGYANLSKAPTITDNGGTAAIYRSASDGAGVVNPDLWTSIYVIYHFDSPVLLPINTIISSIINGSPSFHYILTDLDTGTVIQDNLYNYSQGTGTPSSYTTAQINLKNLKVEVSLLSTYAPVCNIQTQIHLPDGKILSLNFSGSFDD